MFINNSKWNGFEDSKVIRAFYEMTARALLLYFQNKVKYAGPKEVDFREWMKAEADYIRMNDK